MPEKVPDSPRDPLERPQLPRPRRPTAAAVTDEDLATLTPAERADLMRRLVALNVPSIDSPEAERRRHRFTVLCTVASTVLVPWIAVLAVTLPHRYVADHWAATWVGFDALLIVCLSVTAWLASRRRQALIVALIVTGTLLVCDAWFDVMTASSRTDLISSAASAGLVELPLAALLFSLAHRLLGITLHLARVRAGEPGPDVPLYRVPLLGVRPPA